MMVPGYRSREYQKRLFDVGLSSSASVRNVCGEFIELCTEKATGARRLKTDRRYPVCPDMHFKGRVWFECKSVGRANRAIVYQHRIEKENQFLVNGDVLWYWLWHHKARVIDAFTESEVRQRVAGALQCVYVVRQDVLLALLQGLPMQLNSHYYSNHTKAGVFKGSGWKVRTRDLQSITECVGETTGFSVRGVRVPRVPIFSHVGLMWLWRGV